MTDADETAAFLASRPLFAAMSERGRLRLARAARRQTLPEGRVLFERGDAADAAYVVLSGRLAIGVREPDGQEVHFAELGPGAVLGEAAVIDGGPRTASVRAARDAQLLRLPASAFLDAVREEPDLAFALLRDVVAKLRLADGQIEERSALPLAARVARFLLAADGPVTMTQAEMAERLGASREAVNRQLARLAGAGAIRRTRGRVEVTDAALLHEGR